MSGGNENVGQLAHMRGPTAMIYTGIDTFDRGRRAAARAATCELSSNGCLV